MTRMGRRVVTGLALCALTAAAGASAELRAQDGYQAASAGTRMLTLGSGTVIKMLLDESTLGRAEIEVAEITFPAGSRGGGHQHGSTEIFYVVEGVMGHVVNGVEHRLEPGMIGVVRPEDEVAHRVLGDGPVKAVVLWVPGGEAARLAPAERWTPIGN